MKKYDVLLYRGNSIFSKVISFFTKSKYTHCGIILDNGHIAECDIRYSFRIRHISYPSKKYDIFRCTKEIDHEKMIDYIHNHIGTKYDYIELLRCIGLGVKDRKNRLICSEAVYDCFKHAGIDLLNNDDVVTPADISESKYLEKVT